MEESQNNIENGIISDNYKGLLDNNHKEQWANNINGSRTPPQNMAASMVRKKSDPILVSNVRFQMLRSLLNNLQEVVLGTKLALLFPAIPLAIAADFYHFGRVSLKQTILIFPYFSYDLFIFCL